MSVDQQVEWLAAGAVEVVPHADLAAKLREAREQGRPLRVKLGMDPTAPDLHLGHAVVLRKLRQFQELGHEIQLVIGDFTALIGDPSGRSETRKPLTPEEVRVNAETYQTQAYRILDPARTRVVSNNDWLGAMRFADVVRLTSRFTVARLLERDDFSRRYQEGRPIAVHEFMYAFAQAYDSVELESDVELGGTDQRFNILMGRDIQASYGLPPQVGIFMPLLVGLDGVQKMSKSLGNYVGITEPPAEQFGKLMSIPDRLLPDYWRAVTSAPEREWRPLCERDPMEAKKRLAGTVVADYHGAAAAAAARAGWEQVFSRREIPDEIPEFVLDPAECKEGGRIWLGRLLVLAGLVSGTREARRMIEQEAVAVDGEKVTDPDSDVTVRDGMVVRVGRRRHARIRLP